VIFCEPIVWQGPQTATSIGAKRPIQVPDAAQRGKQVTDTDF